jgi:hypothetical protein
VLYMYLPAHLWCMMNNMLSDVMHSYELEETIPIPSTNMMRTKLYRNFSALK